MSGAAKAVHPHMFLSAVYSYQLLSRGEGLAVAVLLPWLEVATGLALLTGRMLAGALAVAASLFAVFSIAVGSALWRKMEINCGCFGNISHDLISRYDLARTLGLTALSIVCLLLRGYNRRCQMPK
jgi:hypothetical protein